MPNWCSNTIVIKGDSKKIADILSKIESAEENKLFENLIGLHPEATEENWYETNVKWFGTKWDVSKGDCNTESNEDQITITPMTALSPPTHFCQKLAEKYGVTVELTYFEPGMDFAGRIEFDENGECTGSDEYEYNEGMYMLDRDGFWSDLENGYLDEEMLEDSSLDEYIENSYSFVDEEDIPKVKEGLEKLLNEAGE